MNEQEKIKKKLEERNERARAKLKLNDEEELEETFKLLDNIFEEAGI